MIIKKIKLLKLYHCFTIVLSAAMLSNLHAAYPFADDFESGTANWNASGSWALTAENSVSPVNSLADSPSTLYTNNTDASIQLASPVDLSSASIPVLRFQHWYAIENGYDFGTVELSIDNGVSWESPPLLTCTGEQQDWRQEQLDLSAYVGESILVRFRLLTDASVVRDGWYIDDVLIDEAPAAPASLNAVSTAPNAVELNWPLSTSGDVVAYRIYRGTPGAVDWHDARLMTELSATETNYTDIAVTPKTTYAYRVLAVNSLGLLGISDEASTVTDAGLDFPFFDDGESASSIWNAGAPWALSDDDAFSSSRSWSDSPYGNYENSINTSLQVANSIDLTGAVSPRFGFISKYDFIAGDSGNAEVSVNGSDWTLLKQFTGSTEGEWLRESFDLSAYTGSTTVFLRFRVTTDSSTVTNGWNIDDISLAEAPDTIPAPVIDNIQSHSMRLTWQQNTNALFSHYAIFRSTSTGVGIQDVLMAEIYDRTNTSVTVTGLALDTEYYFRVYAVSTYGAFSADGTESHAHSLNNPIPFSDDFEGSLKEWNLSGSWGIDPVNPYSGTYSLSDSPSTEYLPVNAESTAITAVDLTGATWPVLKFKDRVDLNTGDWIRLYISSDGSSWSARYGIRESSHTGWTEQQVDLSEWAGQPNVRIKFTMFSDSNASTTADGWNIDELAVVEHTPAVAVSYPVSDGFELGDTNWLCAAWMEQGTDVHSGGMAQKLQFAPGGGYYMSELGAELVLTNTVDPQLVFWLKGSITYRSNFRWEVSTDGGLTWPDVSGSVLGERTIADWTRYQVSLADYAGETIRLRYYAYTYYENGVIMAIDDIAVEDQPANAVLNPIVPHLKSVDLSWNASALGSSFNRYEIYRDTSPNVTTDDALVFSSTNVNTLAMTDSGLSIGQTYYYRLFVVNNHEVYSSGYERSTTTVPLSFGFSDPMESMDNWDATGSWDVDSSTKFSGSASIGDSPGDNYAVSQDSYILTAVDLSGTTWPVLRFMDRFELNTGDRIWLDISSDGSSWSSRYGAYVSSRLNWSQQQIDLSEWAGQSNVRIRFHIYSDSNASTTADGWNIDDVEIVEHSALAGVGYPLFEDFEAGDTNWLCAAWVEQGTEVVSGTMAQQLQPVQGGGNFMSELGAELVLTNTVDPQLVFWLKGSITYRSNFRWEVSTDGGLTWPDVSGSVLGERTIADWTRYQVSLAAYVGQTIRLRYYAYTYYNNGVTLAIDDIAVEDQPANAVMNPIVPHLKSVDLSWSASALGGSFKRYEIYRDTNPNVSLDDELVFSSTDVHALSTSDSGLSIGQTYYYRLFVVNNHEVYSTGYERSATTVPLAFGFIDPMENMDNWDATGSWGVDSTTKYSGSASIGDSPGDNYAVSQDSYILTAVDLSGTTWPVLRFMDRFELNTGDRIWLDISSDGSSWSSRYGAYVSSRLDWNQQQIDLSEWAGQSNVRIRFHIYSDSNAATTADGWNIDDVEIVEHSALAGVGYPLFEDFEAGDTNWLCAAWVEQGTEVVSGTMAQQLQPVQGGGNFMSELGAELVLTNTVDPQLVFWLKGSITYGSNFRWEVSADGGLTWPDVSGSVLGERTIADWTRYQVSLAAYAGQTIRLRYYVYTYYNNGVTLAIDDIAVEDQPANAVLNPIVPHLKSVDLSWSASAIGGTFRRYEIYRDTSPNVSLDGQLVFSSTDVNALSMTDSGLSIGQTYYYRLFVVNDHEVYSSGYERNATTVPLAFGFADPMDTLDNWVATGGWGVDSSTMHEGAASVGDSPADNYNVSQDSYILTSVNLSEAIWPVLRFWDRFELNTGDRIRLYISSDGSSWTTRYGAYASSRPEWMQQQIDLSEWAGQPNVRIKFHIYSDSNAATTADGWNVDAIEIVEHTPVAIGNSVYEDFEGDMSMWLSSDWVQQSEDIHSGASALQLQPGVAGGAEYIIELGNELVLTDAVDPQLVYWLKGSITYRSHVRWQASLNDGLTWGDVSGTPVGESTIADWTRYQISLATYVGSTIRLRYKVYAYYDNGVNMIIDDIGIGEPQPDAPVQAAPANYESVADRRPTLVVTNALDYQGDSLEYQFEVFEDSSLSNLVANVPVLASGDVITSWRVDIELPNDAQYWWRCRATDGSEYGPWMITATFYVNQTNSPPSVVELAGPPMSAILRNAGYSLLWYPAVENDAGDYVVDYEVQIATSGDFSEVVVDDASVVLTGMPTNGTWAASIPLNTLSGYEVLINNTVYFWRVRARDRWGDYSEWSRQDLWFTYGSPPPNLLSCESQGDGTILLEWESPGIAVYIDYKESLDSAEEWTRIAGPVSGNSYVITPEEGKKSGFYRVITVE